jgi:hypothetical protein
MKIYFNACLHIGSEIERFPNFKLWKSIIVKIWAKCITKKHKYCHVTVQHVIFVVRSGYVLTHATNIKYEHVDG